MVDDSERDHSKKQKADTNNQDDGIICTLDDMNAEHMDGNLIALNFDPYKLATEKTFKQNQRIGNGSFINVLPGQEKSLNTRNEDVDDVKGYPLVDGERQQMSDYDTDSSIGSSSEDLNPSTNKHTESETINIDCPKINENQTINGISTMLLTTTNAGNYMWNI